LPAGAFLDANVVPARMPALQPEGKPASER
jgi:hypothetical protein